MISEKLNTTNNISEEGSAWFADLIGSILADQIQLETGTADEGKVHFYKTVMSADDKQTFSMMRNTSSKFFIQELIRDYSNELKEFNVKTRNLAFSLSNAKVLVWAEINEDDEQSEDGLILSEAKVNAKYENLGFHISSTIVESCDNIPVPQHYIRSKNK